jgi:hypothetical protein
MLRLSHLHAGMVVFRRHFRHALRDPRRIYWIFRRIVGIVRAGALGSVLERHAAHEDLYSDYADWVASYDTMTEDRCAAIRVRIATLRDRKAPATPIRAAAIAVAPSNGPDRRRETKRNGLPAGRP